MQLIVEIENASGSDEVPDPADMQLWLARAVGERRTQAEINVRLVGLQEGGEFNLRYRNQSGPTNVLSFPADLPDFVDCALLGDLVICAPVVVREAREQGKTPDAHWAHILIHGALHLLGYDHIQDADASIMERLETQILKDLGFPPPYAEDCLQLRPIDNEATRP